MTDPTAAQPVAVVGAGRMGRGIALSFAFSGYRVNLFDSEERGLSVRGASREFGMVRLAHRWLPPGADGD